jgi:hypothetical protein
MSSKGFRNVPGVPDGWELVALRVPDKGEWFIGVDGKPWQAERSSGQVWPIIRKIEQPAKYRHFANAEEFKPNVGRYVEVVKETSECEMDRGDTLLIVGVSYDSVLLYGGWITFKAAFECLVFDDGTPFGVRIDE